MDSKQAREYIKRNVEPFDSLGSFIHAITEREPNDGWGTLDSDGIDPSWYGGTESFAQACEVARYGIVEDTEDIKKFMGEHLKNFNAVGMGSKSKVRNYYCGGSPNVTRAMMGLPRDMRQVYKAPCKTKTIDIMYGNCFAARYDPSEVKEWGSKALAIIEYLQRDGYSVRLSTVSGTTGGCGHSENMAYSVTLKDYNEPLDIQKMSFAFANAGWFRRLGFRWIETCPFYTRPGYITNYGYKCEELFEAYEKVSGEDNVYFIDNYTLSDISPKEWLDSNGLLH